MLVCIPAALHIPAFGAPCDTTAICSPRTSPTGSLPPPPPPPNVPLPPPPPGPSGVVFGDSFESGLDAWTQDAQEDWKDSSQRATDGNHSAEVDGRALDASPTSPLIDLGGATSVTVTYSWYIEWRLDSGEYLAFAISTDGGNIWTEFARLCGNQDQEDVWHHENFVVPSASSIMLRFRGRMSGGSEDANIDNVFVVAG